MGRTVPVISLRDLLLWAGAVALILSLLAMHQLSSNHTAADPGRPLSGAAALPDLDHPTTSDGHRHQAGADNDRSAAEDHHAAVAATTSGWQPASEPGGCAGCPDHHVMALTCLAALVLLAWGWVLSRPARWRGVLLPRLLRTNVAAPALTWSRPALSLAELSISRT